MQACPLISFVPLSSWPLMEVSPILFIPESDHRLVQIHYGRKHFMYQGKALMIPGKPMKVHLHRCELKQALAMACFLHLFLHALQHKNGPGRGKNLFHHRKLQRNQPSLPHLSLSLSLFPSFYVLPKSPFYLVSLCFFFII